MRAEDTTIGIKKLALSVFEKDPMWVESRGSVRFLRFSPPLIQCQQVLFTG